MLLRLSLAGYGFAALIFIIRPRDKARLTMMMMSYHHQLGVSVKMPLISYLELEALAA
jgi:hypothetical protein